VFNIAIISIAWKFGELFSLLLSIVQVIVVDEYNSIKKLLPFGEIIPKRRVFKN